MPGSRKDPNIIITGTPGVGKTSHCELLSSNTGLRHLSVNAVVKERGCHEGWDEVHLSWVVDEDRVLPSSTRDAQARNCVDGFVLAPRFHRG